MATSEQFEQERVQMESSLEPDNQTSTATGK